MKDTCKFCTLETQKHHHLRNTVKTPLKSAYFALFHQEVSNLHLVLVHVAESRIGELLLEMLAVVIAKQAHWRVKDLIISSKVQKWLFSALFRKPKTN